MTNEMIISESQSLYSDIDYCITELLKARTEHNSENEGKALFKMESLMVSTLQHLACIIEQPSLPSNLDEAAQDIVNDAIDTNDTTIVKYQKLLEYLVRAGAEWMAEQGMTMEITDDTEWADLDSFVHKNVTGGSIIQIRKK